MGEPTSVPRALARVLVAAPRGYCAGVQRAIEVVEQALRLYGAPIYVRREIVHNRHVVETLAARGAVFVREVGEVPRGSRVVFSAHGVSPAVRRAARERGLRVIDATCPLVTKVHREALRFAREGYDIVLVGHAGHEEVEGTRGEAPGRTHVVGTPAQVESLEVRDPARVAWLSQTTLSVDETRAVVARLRERFPLLADPPSDDICYATQNRQEAVRAIAPRADVMVVVGSANSSNSVRLVEVARESGASRAYRVDDARELRPEWFALARTVGVTSGASVPESLVRGVVEWLGRHGMHSVQVVRTRTETTRFALPRGLRAELAGRGYVKPQARRDRSRAARAEG